MNTFQIKGPFDCQPSLLPSGASIAETCERTCSLQLTTNGLTTQLELEPAALLSLARFLVDGHGSFLLAGSDSELDCPSAFRPRLRRLVCEFLLAHTDAAAGDESGPLTLAGLEVEADELIELARALNDASSGKSFSLRSRCGARELDSRELTEARTATLQSLLAELEPVPVLT